MNPTKEIKFILNDEEHTVQSSNISPTLTLLQYIRQNLQLTGTKYMCLEGGCGACIVSVTTEHPLTKRMVTFAVNACLVVIYMCDGWNIKTVEGIGNKRTGYHPVQKALAKFNGTQCGFCSPGMVMNMYALCESNKNLMMRDVEASFGSNMCRCTGYRPILTAFKSICTDADQELLGKFPDIEDLQTNMQGCQKLCLAKPIPPLHHSHQRLKWFKVSYVHEIIKLFWINPFKSYQLIAGNTAKGVYKDFNGSPDMYIDVTHVPELLRYFQSHNYLFLGANITLTDAIEIFRKSAKFSGFEYLNRLADHFESIGHLSLRNVGTLAGNLSIKHKRNEFYSDIFVILEAVGAKITIVSPTNTKAVSLLDYLSYNMERKVIKNIMLPRLNDSYKFETYKIMPRAQNASSIVNAGFLIKLYKNQIVQSARLVYGGINPRFVHARTTEEYLNAKHLFRDETLQGAFAALDRDVQPDDALPQPSSNYRKSLTISLLYKFILSIAPEEIVSSRYKSGGTLLYRPLSNGVQDFETNESLYPLTQAIPKLEALNQTSGELRYITDFPDMFGQLFAAFVTAKAPANSIINLIDPSKAVSEKGVVSFYSAKDVPGKNTFIPLEVSFPDGFVPPSIKPIEEELFCSGVVKYYHQPIGVIVAESQEIADKAADLVKVTYDAGKEKPLLTVRQILAANATDRIIQEATLEPINKRGQDVKHIIKGTFDTSWQYHYHMETQICSVIPTEDGLNIYPSTQWMDIVQIAVAKCLNIPENKINISVKAVGGAFGAKITRNAIIACATALAAFKLHRPVKMRMSLELNMNVIGKRFPSAADYEVGLNDEGLIQYLNCKYYIDYASGGNESIVSKTIGIFGSSYKHDTWKVIGNAAKTDNHAGVMTRAPGHTKTMAMIETILEHAAMNVGINPLNLRLLNLTQDPNNKLHEFIKEFIQWSDYNNRFLLIQEFNKNNRWTKKGLSLVPMTYNLHYIGQLSSAVTIYAGDGSVAISHGGIESGQGINTKVAQACAYKLGIGLDMVSVKSSSDFLSPNNFTTGASITSELVCYATLRACETLLERMKPIKDKMKNPTWKDLIKQCQKQNIQLNATHMFSLKDPPMGYKIYGVCATEVEVDILTGAYQILRVDILEDTGSSISPLIDIGQVEGAFIMGLGFWTMEKIVTDTEGRILTNRTWNYKIPGALDIPIDFRVKFPKNNPNPNGVLHSKATAEPPLCLSCSVPIAIRQAVASARIEADSDASRWYPINGPSDLENTFVNSLNDYKQYKL